MMATIPTTSSSSSSSSSSLTMLRSPRSRSSSLPAHLSRSRHAHAQQLTASLDCSNDSGNHGECHKKNSQSWSCAVCTFDNFHGDFLACEVCGTARPDQSLPQPTVAAYAPGAFAVSNLEQDEHGRVRAVARTSLYTRLRPEPEPMGATRRISKKASDHNHTQALRNSTVNQDTTMIRQSLNIQSSNNNWMGDMTRMLKQGQGTNQELSLVPRNADAKTTTNQNSSNSFSSSATRKSIQLSGTEISPWGNAPTTSYAPSSSKTSSSRPHKGRPSLQRRSSAPSSFFKKTKNNPVAAAWDDVDDSIISHKKESSAGVKPRNKKSTQRRRSSLNQSTQQQRRRSSAIQEKMALSSPSPYFF